MPTTAGPAHDHDRCVSDALASAESVCARQGARLTPLRRRVLELLWTSHEAVKAYDLLERLQAEDPAAKPTTVYRALDFLMAHGLVHRVESLNAFVGCPHPEQRHTYQLLICDACGQVEELAAPEVTAAIDHAARQAGFTPQQRTIEIHGLCRLCAQSRG